eukprot:gene32181-27953_t
MRTEDKDHASLNPAHQGARPMLSSSEMHNTVALADVVPRFPLLPLGSAGSRNTEEPGTTKPWSLARVTECSSLARQNEIFVELAHQVNYGESK